jgi:hypothetical protein
MSAPMMRHLGEMGEKGSPPVTLPSCETSAIELKIKKLKCKFSMVDVSTTPSPVTFARERINIRDGAFKAQSN